VIAGDDDSEPSASNDFGTITGPNGVAIPGGPYGDPLGKVICITGMVSESGSSYAGKTIRLFVTNNMTTLTGILDVSVAIGQGKISETGSAAVGLFDFSPKADQAVCALIVIYDETGYVGAWQTITHTSLFASFDEVTFIKLDCKELGVAILPVSR
jgi:hypothetical protein